MEWIKVSNKLPEKHNDIDYYSEWVLVADSTGYIFKSRYDYKYKLWVNKPNICPDPVTHWMPLPNPPKNG